MASETMHTVVDAIIRAAADPKTVVTIDLPADEKTAVLANLVADVRDLFVASSEYGLDGYLSVRIRHGTLAGELRSTIEGAHLLTEKERISGGHSRQTYWSQFFSDPERQIEIGKKLAKFSADFDSLLARIRGEWIQIRTREDQKGVFDFRVTDNQLAVLAASTTPETTFEQFIDLSIATLWQKLDTSLTIMRQRIHGEAKSAFDALLEHLLLDVEKMSKRSRVTDLDSAIKETRIALSNALNRIAEWFQLPKQTSTTPFPIEDAVTIAIESVRRFHREVPFNPDVSVSPGITLPGLLLPGVVDVCIIIFENIVRHARTEGPPKVDVAVNADDEWIFFRIENEVGPNVWCESAVERVKTLKEAVEHGDYKRSVAAEGGTGFHKLWKIVAYDISPGAQLDFGFRNHERFFVELAIARQVRL